MDARKDYSAALALRLRGKTYGEIRNIFGVPKSTQSSWFKNLKLSNTARIILRGKQRAGLAALGEFNKSRTIANQLENESIRKLYEKKISKLAAKELMLIGAALYWGEGYRNFGKPKYTQVCFANSDVAMVLVFMKFLERILMISRNKIKATVMIHLNLIPSKALNYWMDILKLPEENFRVQRFVSPASKNIRPKNSLPYGTLQLRVNRRQEFYKIKGLIDGIIKSV